MEAINQFLLEKPIMSLTIVAFVVAIIVEAIKNTGQIKKEYISIISILIGVIATILASFILEIEPITASFYGVIIGALATAIYENFKNINKLM